MSFKSSQILILLLVISFASYIEANSIFKNRYTAEFEHSKYLTYVITGVAIAVGMVAVFFGYKLLKPFLFVFGFVIAAGITYLILWHYTKVGLVVIIFAPLIAGIAGGFVLLFLMKVGIFFLGSAAGFILFCTLMSVRDEGLIHEPIAIDVGLVVCPIIGGIIALLIQKPLIIFSTSFGGSYAVIAGVDRFVHGGFSQVIPNLISNHRELIGADFKTYIEIGVCFALTIVGIYVQFRHTGKNTYHNLSNGHPTPESDGYYPLN